MHPVLFEIGQVPVHTYGFLIAIGFLVALSVVKRLSLRSGLDAERVLDLSFWCFLVGFIGARILFIITRWQYFSAHPADMLRVWEGGLVFFGGPIAAVPFAIWFLRRHRMPVWKVSDVLAPGLTAAHAFGRLGCLAAGCCYGRPTGGGWGIRLDSDLVDEALHGHLLHPTQLYEATALAVLFFGLLWVHRHRRFDGQVVLTYFMAYPIIRSLVEIFRGDTIRGFVIDGVLSTSQFISILVFLAASAVLAVRLRQVRTLET